MAPGSAGAAGAGLASLLGSPSGRGSCRPSPSGSPRPAARAGDGAQAAAEEKASPRKRRVGSGPPAGAGLAAPPSAIEAARGVV